MSSLAICGLAKHFVTPRGKTVVVRDLDLVVPTGEIYALLGPSGCGKTTTLRCVAGLETAERGRISLGDRTLFDAAADVDVRAHERDIGMVFQSYAIWPHMNVHENVAYPLRAIRPSLDPAAIDARVGEALRLVGLESFDRHAAASLSGGQQQRVALARALVRRPTLLLLDEPLSNLDAALRREMRADLRSLVKRLGVTTLYVTHDQREAFAIADRVGVMAAGELLQEGPPRSVYDRPASPFVAAFLGHANLLHARVAERRADGMVTIAVGTDGASLTVRGEVEAEAGDLVTLMVRPEDVAIAPAARALPFEATVREIAYEGSAVQCTLTWSGLIVRARADRAFAAEAGTRVSLAIDPTRCVLFRAG